MSYIMDRFAKYGLNDVMEFDHVITVHADGTVTDGPAGIYAPDLYHVEGAQHPNDVENTGPQGWELLHGFTAQDSYNGAVNHASEFIGGGLERHIMANPGLYVACVVNGYSDDSDVYDGYAEPEPAGWAVAYMEEPPEPEGV